LAAVLVTFIAGAENDPTHAEAGRYAAQLIAERRLTTVAHHCGVAHYEEAHNRK
jgi:hypothetical protein